MNKSRILLAVESQLVCETLREAFRKDSALEVVGESGQDPVDVLVAVRRTGPDVLIHSWEQDGHLKATQSHIFAEFPDLVMVSICLEEESSYAQCQIGNLDSLFSFLRNARRCA